MRVRTSGLFTERLRNGVFRAQDLNPLEDIKTDALKNGFRYVELNGLEITSKQQFLTAIEYELVPPISFQANWDAFESDLKGLEWISEPGVVIVYQDFHVFQQADSKEFQTLLDIVYTVVQLKTHSSHPQSKALYVVFYSESDISLPTVEVSIPYLVDK